ncbi:unnamed protein product [Boreogadus saida]
MRFFTGEATWIKMEKPTLKARDKVETGFSECTSFIVRPFNVPQLRLTMTTVGRRGLNQKDFVLNHEDKKSP